MAKDDYDVIVYRVLVYLYACFKRKIIFELITFKAAAQKGIESDEYFTDALKMMQSEGFIEGLTFVDAWGGETILASDLSNARITPAGIRYLESNSKMSHIGDYLKSTVDIIAKLAGMLWA